MSELPQKLCTLQDRSLRVAHSSTKFSREKCDPLCRFTRTHCRRSIKRYAYLKLRERLNRTDDSRKGGAILSQTRKIPRGKISLLLFHDERQSTSSTTWWKKRAPTRLEGVSGEFCEPLYASTSTCVCVKMRVSRACHVALKAGSQETEASTPVAIVVSIVETGCCCLRERIVG